MLNMTTIGTPLSPNATKVMLLGSGELGKEVLIALQRLGVETIAVDRYDNAPGQQVAHHARTITLSDPAHIGTFPGVQIFLDAAPPGGAPVALTIRPHYLFVDMV